MRQGSRYWDLLAIPVVAGVVVAAVALLARWWSGDAAIIVGPAAATTVILVLVGRQMRQARTDARRRDARSRRRLANRSARLEKVIRRQNRELFDQLTELDAVRDLIAGSVALPRTRGWAASPDILREIVGTVLRDRPQVVVETGTGSSTVAIAACLRRIGGGHLWSLEHLPAFAAAIRSQLAMMGLEDFVTVVDAPLVDVSLPAGTWPWYDTSGLDVGGPIDLLFVDGPPEATAPMARYPALPVLRSRLAGHAVVILDDADRADERECVRRWQAETPGLSGRHLPFKSGAWVLRLGDVTGA